MDADLSVSPETPKPDILRPRVDDLFAAGEISDLTSSTGCRSIRCPPPRPGRDIESRRKIVERSATSSLSSLCSTSEKKYPGRTHERVTGGESRRCTSSTEGTNYFHGGRSYRSSPSSQTCLNRSAARTNRRDRYILYFLKIYRAAEGWTGKSKIG